MVDVVDGRWKVTLTNLGPQRRTHAPNTRSAETLTTLSCSVPAARAVELAEADVARTLFAKRSQLSASSSAIHQSQCEAIRRQKCSYAKYSIEASQLQRNRTPRTHQYFQRTKLQKL